MAERFFSDQWYRVAGLSPRLLAGVTLERQRLGGRPSYILKDPLTHRTHRIDPAAMLFLRYLDGRRSVESAWTALLERLGAEAPSQEQVVDLLASLHSQDLLDAETIPDVAELAERRGKQDRALLKQNVMGPLSFRVPLFDPDWILSRTLPLVRPLISRWGALAWLVLLVYAGIGALSERAAIAGAFADQVWTAASIAIVAGTYVLMKVFHEAAHGWVAKAAGAPVHETGLMFLVFMPVPYVDASASAGLANRWARIAVSGAGIIAETTMAAVAFLFWAEMEPGPLRAVLFNIMLIGSVSTVLVNGNPLLKFDGYFVLCDFLGLPNLAQRATRWWGDMVQVRLFRVEGMRRPPSTLAERIAFIIYGPASFIYRIFLTLGIAIYVAGSFFVVGVVLAALSFTQAILRPTGKAIWHLFTAPILRQRRPRALWITGGAAAILLGFLILIPMPEATRSLGVIQSPNEAAVRTEEAGRIITVAARAGAQVTPGTVLAVLEDPLADARIAALEWRVEEFTTRLRRDRLGDLSTARITELELEAETRALERERARAEARHLRARIAGVFVPTIAAEDLAGRYLSAGDTIGHVLPDQAETVRLVVPQSAIGLVEARGVRRVIFRLPGDDTRYDGAGLTAIDAGAFRLPSPALALSRGGIIATEPDGQGGERALARLYHFDTSLPADLPPEVWGFGQRVHVRLEHPRRALGWQWADRLRRAFLRGIDV